MLSKLSLVQASQRKQLDAVLDLHRGEFQLNGQALPLGPTAFRLATYFVQNHGRLLTKDELVKAVWPHAVVTDDSLVQCVAQLRAALGDESQTFVKTVRGRGYIFEALVTLVSNGVWAQPNLESAQQKRAAAQKIQFCTTQDKVQLAYGVAGLGSPLVEVGTWINHLEADWDSPVWRSRLRTLSSKNKLVRYDCRGCGLSDRQVPGFSFELALSDLETVVDAAGLDRFSLLGSSQGAGVAIAYAALHPERVKTMVLYGAFARGRLARNPSEQDRKEAQAMRQLIEIGWGRPNPAFRQIFTSMLIPDSTPEQYQWFTELQRTSTSPENAAHLIAAYETMDIGDLLCQVQCPALVIHSRDDPRVPLDEARYIAGHIQGARFVTLESRNHILLEQEPAWQQFLDELQAFVDQTADPLNQQGSGSSLTPVSSNT